MQYSRASFQFQKPTPIVKVLLISMLVSYVLFALSVRSSFGALLYDSLAFRPELALGQLQVWRFLTYGALHSVESPIHFLLNGLMLYMLGCELESRWGERRFITFLILTTVGGGVFVSLAWLVGLTDQMVVGFSAATIGMLVAWCIIYSYRTLLLFGLIAVRGQQLLWGVVGFELLSAIAINHISSAAHFGGMAMGAFLTTGAWRKLPMARQRY